MNWLGVSGPAGPNGSARPVVRVPRTRRRVIAALAVAPLTFGAASCGGDDDAAPSTSRPNLTAPPAPTSGPPTAGGTSLATSSSQLPTADTVSTSGLADNPAQSTSSTVFPTPPTLYAGSDPRAEVEAAYLAYRQMRLACTAAYPNCDTSQFSRYLTGDALETAVHNVSAINEGGYIAERVSEYRQEVTEIHVDGDIATVISCEWDPIKIYRPATDQRPEHVFNDTVESGITSGTMRKIDGQWKFEYGETLERIEGGESLCD